MENIQISDYFKNYYLTCGKTHDNFIFENCPIEFMKEAKDLLSKSCNNTKACVVSLTKQEEDCINRTLKNCETDYQKKLIARDYICAKIMLQLNKDCNNEVYQSLCEGVNNILNNDWQQVKRFHAICPMPNEVGEFSKKIEKIELCFFLIDVNNVYLQQSINTFIASREPYSVKIFTNNEKLPTYYNQTGDIIQSPHDYMTRNVRDYITYNNLLK